MPRMPSPPPGPDGWTPWIPPVMTGYRLGCCDCGLVHTMDFQVVKVLKELPNGRKEVQLVTDPRYEVMFRARRNKRSTAARRRKK